MMLSVNTLVFIETYLNNPCEYIQIRNNKSNRKFFNIFFDDFANNVDVKFLLGHLKLFAEFNSVKDFIRLQR